jgi:hypothetical protein
MNYLGGHRNTMTLVLTGLGVEEKADLALRTVTGVSLAEARALAGDDAELARRSRLAVAELSAELVTSGIDDPALPGDAQSYLRITAKDPDAAAVGKPFTAPVIEATLASYPGMFPTTPPGPATPYGVYWPTTVAREHVPVRVLVDGQPIAESTP